SLGVGGTNAHVVLEEAPAPERSAASRGPFVLPFSARTETALQSTAGQLSDSLLTDASPLADVAYTLGVGRAEMHHRAAIVASSSVEAARLLRTRHRWIGPTEAPSSASAVFLFAGGGAQYVGMGAGLYGRDPVFTSAMDTCIAHVLSRHDIDLRPLLDEADEKRLQQPSNAFPDLIAMQYVLAQWW